MSFLVDTVEELRAEWRRVAAGTGPIGFDVESTGGTIKWGGKNRPDLYSHRITGFSLSVHLGVDIHCFYVPVRHTHEAARNVPLLAAKALLSELVRLAENGRTVWAHNLGYELQMLINDGILPAHRQPPKGFRCSELATWLAWTVTGKDLGLKKARVGILGLPARPDYREVVGTSDVATLNPAVIAEYAALDAADTVQLGEKAWASLEASNLVQHYQELDLPLVEIVRGSGAAGMGVKHDELTALQAAWEAKRDAAAARFEQLTTTTVTVQAKADVPTGEYYKSGKRAGEPKTKKQLVPMSVTRGADVGNDGQVARWLYDELKWWPVPEEWNQRVGRYEPISRNDKGVYSVAAEYVQDFVLLDGPAAEAAKLRLEYQKYDKLVSTYCLPLLRLPEMYGDGNIHPALKITGTRTQRFSSSGPNFQNLPARSEEGQQLRKCITAGRPGWKLVVRDYSQVELRLQAELAKDAPWLAAYEFGVDVHQQTATALKVPRRVGKEVNLSVIYGVGEDTLAQRIDSPDIGRDEARALIDGFYREHPAITDYQRRAAAYATKRGYIVTRDGYKRFGLVARWRPREGRECLSPKDERRAANTPVQGLSGGLMKASMIDLWTRWTQQGIYGAGVLILMSVHDELVVGCDPSLVHQVGRDMDEVMTRPRFGVTVELPVDGGCGETWGNAK